MPTLLTFESTLISLWMRQKLVIRTHLKLDIYFRFLLGVLETPNVDGRTDHISQPHVKFDENR